MTSSVFRGAMAIIAGAVVLARTATAQAPDASFKPPEEVRFRTASIVSEGTRMAAEVYSPKASEGKRLPTVILCHGWGGTAADLRPQAIAFAQAGYLAVAFDYRGWGKSDSRLVVTGWVPAEKPHGRFTAEVREVREVVDPLDQTTDLQNAIHWAQAEPQCDPAPSGCGDRATPAATSSMPPLATIA